MEISHIGHTTVRTPTRDLHLKNILHVPDAAKNLISAHRLSTDNHTFLEVHPTFFLVKEQGTRKTLLRGRCRQGLYPVSSAPFSSSKQAFGANKLPVERWHSRLGHPSSTIVRHVLSHNNIPFSSSELNKEGVCDACQMGKSHQLPYPSSNSVSKAPLEQIFFDVWGPAHDSINKKNYYVSFIDDYSKFTWIYLLKHRSEVFKVFHEFQTLVERLFNKKIITMQTD